jgi:hypothetical protein
MDWFLVNDTSGVLNTIRSEGSGVIDVRDLATWHGHAKKEQDAGTARATTSDEIALQA